MCPVYGYFDRDGPSAKKREKGDGPRLIGGYGRYDKEFTED